MSTVKKVDELDGIKIESKLITNEQLQADINYIMAQHITEMMLKNNLISDNEFKEISRLNRESFKPYLYELMD